MENNEINLGWCYVICCVTKNFQISKFVLNIQIKTEMSTDDENAEIPNVHIWLRFNQIKFIYLMNRGHLRVEEWALNREDQDKWVEVPNDNIARTLLSISPNEQVIPMMIEIQNEDKTWPRAKGNDWRQTLQTGDIIDAKDKKGKWYESLVRYVYPTSSTEYGKCIIHFIGWNRKWDEELFVNDYARLAKRHTHTTGPYVPRPRGVSLI